MTAPHLARVLPIQREDKDVYFKRKNWFKNDEDRDFWLITANDAQKSTMTALQSIGFSPPLPPKTLPS